MRVIVYAEDLSGRKDDGYYSKSDITSALDIFYGSITDMNFSDPEREHELIRKDAEDIFNVDRRVKFYNVNGEKVVISADPSA